MRYSVYKGINLVPYLGRYESKSWKIYEFCDDAYLITYFANRTEEEIPYSDVGGIFFDEDDHHVSKWIKCNDPLWIKAIEQFPYFGMKIVEIPDDVDWELVREYNYYEEKYEERIEEKHRTWD